MGKKSASLYRLLQIKLICNLVFRIRFFYFVHVRRCVRYYPDETGVYGSNYSKERLYLNKPQRRILRLIYPLASIPSLSHDGKILAIGCRYESDMLYLIALGFHPSRIRGLDMISYSPWVDVGNMHSMPYGDNEWDAILMGWTLPYSSEPETAAKEIIRVTRNGGLVAIGHTYYPPATIHKMKRDGELVGTTDRIQTVERILGLFQPYVDKVHFQYDAPFQDQESPCLVLFSIKK